MQTSKLVEQIREANLSYLLLAKQLIAEDKAEAMVRLGINEQTVELLDQMTTAQVLKVASNNVPMCTLRFDSVEVLTKLANEGKDKAITGLHAAILMAGRSVELV